ncbi:MAG: SDR family NAD(P)-dependent oxidoreductase [Gemmatimonadota bacterium]
MELDGKVVMISGGSKGLGAALARRFAKEGAKVSLCARGEDDLREIADELVAEIDGADVFVRSADVTSEEEIASWIEDTRAEFGRIDAFVNNASLLGPRVGIEEYPLDDWRKVIDVNLTGAFICARAVAPALRETKGSIVHVSSGVGDHGRPYWGAYSASKNGVEALSQMMAGELEEAGIRSNAVDPGKMRTEMRAAAYPDEDPMTLPTPDEVTDVFLYLVSDASSAVSGERFRAQEFERP